ncbi:MAG: hypothetical protein HYT38_02190 [Candidatus Sungbacteria bacterium]|uniref:Uncharacterized protein n=1 Tax=Candidatus Sungiibacteriota bacterium TaxID=2750080 RepID=A0A931YDT2_9BACT|nr:hypothetical protein [Candidatus Sungbacteria bacterium]MBI2466071.1 hypothetical protein [Candidatus Sungbacteria bacterium]
MPMEQESGYKPKFEFNPETELSEAVLEKAVGSVTKPNKGFELNAAETAADLKTVSPDRLEGEVVEKLKRAVLRYRDSLVKNGDVMGQITEAELLNRLCGLSKEELGLTDKDFEDAMGEIGKYASAYVGEDNTDSLAMVERELFYEGLVALKRMYPPQFSADRISPELFNTAQDDVADSRRYMDMRSPDFTVKRVVDCAELYPDRLAELGVTPELAEMLREKLRGVTDETAVKMAADLKRLEFLLNSN